MRAGGLAVQVVHHELVAGLLQVGRHMGAHGAQPDESDLHGAAVPASMAS